jgi:hypothetical protein
VSSLHETSLPAQVAARR